MFGRVVRTRSRETAFIYAINSAAAMYEMTKACTRGDLKKCNCNQNYDNNAKKYQWAGCSDNVFFGHKLSKYFVDSNEYTKSPYNTDKEYKLMNLHNNEVGRRVSLFDFFYFIKQLIKIVY